ncbi:MAG: GNVR domain-containing protein [Gammaproteobacteria bacterium]|jgi:polysaccharide chain length determinant protein (PEP-CTERM system associated)|nr:GNVR domain-containing protein [Gammaproteobacteria bacterium]
MHDLMNQVVAYARGMWRYRWLALALAWVISIAGWIHAAQLADVYRASARVHIDTDSMLRPLLRGLAVEANISQRIQLMTRTLLSQPNMEKLARMTDVHLRAKTPEALERQTEQMRRRISISSEVRQPNLFTISYNDTDPQQAHRVVQALLTIFMETTLGESRQDGDTARRFLDEQIAEYEQRLAEAEARLAAFRRDNVGMLPGDRGGYYQRLQGVEGQLEATRLQLRETENRRAELARQLERERPSGQASAGASVWDSPTRVDARIGALQVNLDDLLLRYTENHPDVISLRKTIADLELERERELALRAEAMADFDLGSGPQSSPVAQQIRMSMSGSDAEIASLKVRVAEFERQRDRLKEMVDTIPKIEAEMQRLDRDYNVNRSQYEELLRRRESAQLSKVAEDQGEQVQFRIIDPARLPRDPDGPDRPALYSASLFAGLGGGLGLAFLLAQLRPVFDNRRILSEVTGFPVLGTVSWVRDSAQQARARIEMAGFGLAGVMLLLCYGGVVMLGAAAHNLLTRFT